MDLLQAVTERRTLVVEGCDGVSTSGLTTQLARFHGFAVERPSPELRPADPAGPYFEALRRPGRLVLDGGFLHELVYGPLRRGQSRLSWIQALDFADALAARDGAFVHLCAPARVLLGRPASADDRAPDPAEITAAVTGYAQALTTLGQHAPVLVVDEAWAAAFAEPDSEQPVPLAAARVASAGRGAGRLRDQAAAGRAARLRGTARPSPTFRKSLITDGKLIPIAGHHARQENSS